MPKYKTVIPTKGQDGNIFAILANASNLLRQLGTTKQEIKTLREKVMSSGSYEEAKDHIREYFELEGK
jgi:hypothetical protein